MDAWIQEILKGQTFGFMVLLASFLFGLSSAATTAGCGGLPAMLVILGYTGSAKTGKTRQLLTAAGAFTLSSVVALGALGALMSFAGGDIMTTTGRLGFYVKKVLGFVCLILGLSALDWLPIRFPTFKVATEKLPGGTIGALLLGATVGLATAGCAAACSPLQLPIVLGLAALRGQVLEGTIILVVFAIGFVAPLVAIMLGLGMGRATRFMEKMDKPLRYISGVFLILLGFWLVAQIKTGSITGF
ncbi:MAG: cytochrome c biogenesis protein CcdA [Dehalococcoidales bacterium]|jgi:cytochrome c biogenesis protein CcdA